MRLRLTPDPPHLVGRRSHDYALRATGLRTALASRSLVEGTEMNRIAASLLLGAAAGACLVAIQPPDARAQGVIFKVNEVDEAALIDALTPPPPGVRTRSIMVQPKAKGTPGENPRAGAASITITFATGSSEITPDSKAALDVIARALTSERLTDFSFAVEGHADPRGDDDFNLRLSQARAESVVAYLVNKHSLPTERLHPIGKGETELARPDVPTAPENRRVTFKTERR
jgi:OmpA-OmpF porin, OOP family